MELKDVVFEPHNDMSADNMEIVTQHDKLIKENKFSDATTLLDEGDYQEGFRAPLFNGIQNKIHKIQEHLLNKFVSDKDEYYSYDEPSTDFMVEHGYKYWCKII